MDRGSLLFLLSDHSIHCADLYLSPFPSIMLLYHKISRDFDQSGGNDRLHLCHSEAIALILRVSKFLSGASTAHLGEMRPSSRKRVSLRLPLFMKEKNMLSRLSDRFYTWAKGWLILSVIGAFVLLVNLPLADPALLSMSLDGRFGYTPEQAFSAVASYGDKGRVQMIWIHLGDFILITLYTSMFCLSISWLFQRGFELDSRMRRLNIVPLLGGFFDAMENIWIITMILVYPAQPTTVAWLSTISTMSKYIMGILIVLLLLIGLVKAAMNRFKVQEAVTMD